MTDTTEDTPEDTPAQWVHPDKSTLARLAGVGMLAAALAAMAWAWGLPRLGGWMNDPAASVDVRSVRTAWFTLGMVCAIAAGCSGLAAWLGLAARRIHRAQAFPPPGYPVLVKTRLLHGDAAGRQARQHAIAGLACLLIGASVLGGLFWMLPLVDILRLLAP